MSHNSLKRRCDRDCPEEILGVTFVECNGLEIDTLKKKTLKLFKGIVSPWTKKDRGPYTLELLLVGKRLKELLSCKHRLHFMEKEKPRAA